MALDEKLLATLNTPQRQAVTHGTGPLLILAGAGSGKTRVITTRIAHLLSEGINPWNILAVTFTNKAAGEMRKRVDDLTGGAGRAVWVSTFHSFCAQFLRVEARAIGLDPHFTIYDDNDQTQIIKECLRELNLDEKKVKPNQVISVISRAKDDLLDAESYAIHAMAQNDPFRTTAASLYTLYQRKMAKANALDFGDLILKSTMALRDNPTVREKYQARFHYVLVDEYQDTNHAQYLLAKLLVGPAKNLCCVGDDDQSVYSWRGADIRNILEFERDYPGAAVVKLEQNYRSTEAILVAAHSLIVRNRFRKDKKLWTESKGGEPVQFREFADELEEARAIARETAEAVATGRWGRADVAVFYRTNAQSRVLEDAFRKENLPYTLVGSVRFYERMEVKDVLAYLRVALNPADGVATKRVINNPPRGIGKTSIQAIDQRAATAGLSFFDAVRQMSLTPESGAAGRNLLKFMDVMAVVTKDMAQKTASQMVQTALEATGYWAHWEEQVESDPEAAHRLDNLQELVNAAKEFEEASEDKSLLAFLEKVSLASGLDDLKEDGGTVTLMTVHLAKGLEFPVVYVTGLEEGLFPIGESAFDEKELEEERRLAYVAITRARLRLTLSAASSRRIYGRSHWNVPSRFVAEAGLAPERVAAPTSTPFAQYPSPAPRAAVSSFDPDEAETSVPVGGRDRPLRVGQRVRHPMFGAGQIIDKSGSGENLKVTVLFDNGARKNILARYANFETV